MQVLKRAERNYYYRVNAGGALVAPDFFVNEKFRKGKIKLAKGGKPYIKKLCRISEVDVWLVNGAYIRDNICEDFVNFDHHYHLRLIPKNEFWIAKEAKHDETRFYIDRMLAERRMIAAGASYEKANARAELIERAERSKSRMMKRMGRKKLHRQDIISRIHRKTLYRSNGLKVWLVNGELVRDFFMTDYAGGGHDRVYHFIPEGEVWIDDDIPPADRKFIIIHELHERALMAEGKDYPHSHEKATEVEDYFRHHPKRIGKTIEAEIIKQ